MASLFKFCLSLELCLGLKRKWISLQGVNEGKSFTWCVGRCSLGLWTWGLGSWNVSTKNTTLLARWPGYFIIKPVAFGKKLLLANTSLIPMNELVKG